jgi:DNA-directed RNA polymerase specialized sigma24 family protein
MPITSAGSAEICRTGELFRNFAADSESLVPGGIYIGRSVSVVSMGDVTAANHGVPTPGAHLCADEVLAAFDSLSHDDKLKLGAVEGIKRRGTGFGRGQLLHEAFCQVILGKRKCPRDVSLMAFLVQTMRSLASHDRERRRKIGSPRAAPREGPAMSAATPPNQTAAAAAADLDSRETVEAIFNIFDGDEKARLVVMAWADGCRGADLREATGLDQGAIDYAAKRIRKKMKALYPHGWTE